MVKELNSSNFEKEISSGIALVDFWAEWCGPCRMMSPTVDAFSESHPEISVGKVNVDICPELADKFGINMIPALIFFKDGEEKARLIGVSSPEKLAETANSLK